MQKKENISKILTAGSDTMTNALYLLEKGTEKGEGRQKSEHYFIVTYVILKSFTSTVFNKNASLPQIHQPQIADESARKNYTTCMLTLVKGVPLRTPFTLCILSAKHTVHKHNSYGCKSQLNTAERLWCTELQNTDSGQIRNSEQHVNQNETTRAFTTFACGCRQRKLQRNTKCPCFAAPVSLSSSQCL